jgi:hypothetical protein
MDTGSAAVGAERTAGEPLKPVLKLVGQPTRQYREQVGTLA